MDFVKGMNTEIDNFFLDGDAGDLAYANIRDLPHHEDAREFILYLWRIYMPYADSHFREDAKNHFLQRFWEMYLAVTFINHGLDLHRAGQEGPEFYIEQNKRRVWVEAIAPGPGEGKDRVPEVEPGVAGRVPTEKILLRFTHALVEKRRKYLDAFEKGIISPEDGYLLAVNCRAIPHAPFGNTMPFFVQAYLPFGPLAVSIDRDTGDIVQTYYEYRDAISKLNGADISTTAFLDPELGFASAVLNSSVDCVNRPEELGGDFSLLHNPNAIQRLDESQFGWCEQMSVEGDELITRKPS